MAKGKQTPSDDTPHSAQAGRGKSAARYTTPTGKKNKQAADRKEPVSGGPRKTGRRRR